MSGSVISPAIINDPGLIHFCVISSCLDLTQSHILNIRKRGEADPWRRILTFTVIREMHSTGKFRLTLSLFIDLKKKNGPSSCLF